MRKHGTFHYLQFIIIFFMYIDEGDGHWKERDKTNLRHDIELYRKMAEKLEREIEQFYDEYPEEQHKDHNLQSIHNKLATNILSSKIQTENAKTDDKVEDKSLDIELINTTNDFHTNQIVNEMRYNIPDNNKPSNFKTSWPKFDDILLAMGKKYDWKNDRWIKIKEKSKTQVIKDKVNSKTGDNNISEFHEKHKFSYRMVKLKSKSKRNIVVAVSAVR